LVVINIIVLVYVIFTNSVHLDFFSANSRVIIFVFCKLIILLPACGMGPILLEEIKQKLVVIDDLADVVVELVFDPHRLQEMMSDEAKLTLGVF